MRLKAFLLEKDRLYEELTATQKSKVDTWFDSKTRKHPVFSDHVFGDKSRVTIPLEHPTEHIIPHPEIEQHLQKSGYKIKSYADGLASDSQGRDVRIGKVLEKTGADPSLRQKFDNDPARATARKNKNNMSVSIVRPSDKEGAYHVAGMSTDRGWSSCMNMKDGEYKNKLGQDVRHGTHVAYLHNNDDPDIKRPIARIAMKPFYPSDEKNASVKHKNNILRPEESEYGTSSGAFHHTVNKWAETHFPMKHAAYVKNPNVYDDDGNDVIINSKRVGDAIANPNRKIAAVAARHENATDSQIHSALSHPETFVRRSAISNPNIKPEHIDRAMKDEDQFVRGDAVAHKQATAKHISTGLKDEKTYVQTRAASNKNAGPEHLDAAISSKNEEVRIVAARNPNATTSHLTRALKDPSFLVRRAVAHNPSASHAHWDKIINDPDERVRQMARINPNITSDHLHRLLVDPSHKVRQGALYSDKITPEHVKVALKDADPEVRSVAAFNHAHMADEKDLRRQIRMKENNLGMKRHIQNELSRRKMNPMPIKEDAVVIAGAPTNNVGSGHIAGATPGETPPVSKKTQRKIQKRNKSVLRRRVIDKYTYTGKGT